MKKKPVFFNDALKAVQAVLSKLVLPPDINPVVIRDIYGQIQIALDKKAADITPYSKMFEAELRKLGRYGEYEGKKVLSRDDFFDPDSVFNSPDILSYQASGSDKIIQILDRQITGQEWTRYTSTGVVKIQRLVFYGVKGGVGRSTAMAILAYQLAKQGKNVLLIDFDLESPGLSTLMLPLDRMADFGIVDWFVEDTVGQGNEILPRMISISPLSRAEGVKGRIFVAAAMGMEESAYLPKLSRVYADIAKPREGGIERFHERAIRFVKTLEKQVKPDIVLIDSRAGLHDLAAVNILSLATKAFLFAVDSDQTWEGYRLLFSHWQAYPTILKEVRERLVMVDSLFPETNQEARAKSFLDNSYNLFSSTIYDEIAPGSDSTDTELFNFDMGNYEAPHYPLRIKWNARFQEFSERLLSQGILQQAEIESAYGDFLSRIESLLEGTQT